MRERDDSEYVLTADSARRVAAAVRAVEAMTSGQAPARSAPRTTMPSRFAVTTSTITAASGSTLGHGTAALQLIAHVDGTTTWTYAALAGVADVTVLNGGASIASGRLVELKVIDGWFVIDTDFC